MLDDMISNLTQSAANSALVYYLFLRNNHILGALDIHPLHDLPTHNKIVNKKIKNFVHCFFFKKHNPHPN